jgi:hypothetical protein
LENIRLFSDSEACCYTVRLEQFPVSISYTSMRTFIYTFLFSLCFTFVACTTAQRTSPVANTGASGESTSRVLVDFSGAESNWFIQDDRVMGGRSRGKVAMTEDGHLRFWGDVSLENNGGFSSVMSGYGKTYNVDGYTTFSLRVKGDGSAYTFRVMRARNERHSYAYTFPTSGEWETITVPFNQLTPTFRGYTPNLPAYAGEPIDQLRILIGNKKPQSFELLVDEIAVQ